MVLFQAIDRFPVTFNPHIKNSPKFSSILSVFLSFGVIIISAIYFIYVLYLWYNGELLPKQTSQVFPSNNSTLFVGNNTIQFEIYNAEDHRNPLDFKSLMVIPFVITSNLINMTEIRLISPEEVIFSQEYSTNLIELRGQPLTQVVGDKTPNEVQIVFVKCDPSLIVNFSNMTCADSAAIDNYIFDAEFLIYVKKQSWNEKERHFQYTYSENLFVFDDATPTFSNILLQKSQFFIDQQQVIPGPETSDQISDYSLFTQTLQQVKSIKKLNDLTKSYPGNYIVYFSTTFSISRLVEKIIINYPSLGEVIAQINGIYSLLMSLSLIVPILNARKMNDYLSQKIREFYYPEMQYIEVNRSLFGSIKEVKNTKTGATYDVKELEKQIEVQDRIIEKKRNYLNIIYEISRLQFAVQSLVKKTGLQSSRKQGIKLNLKDKNTTTNNKDEYQNIQNESSSRMDLNFDDEDAEIICFFDDEEKENNNNEPILNQNIPQSTKVYVEPV